MLLMIQPYDLQLKYRSGKDILLADAPGKNSKEVDLDERVDLVHVCTKKLATLKIETNHDAELSALKEVILEGWLGRLKQVASPI